MGDEDLVKLVEDLASRSYTGWTPGDYSRARDTMPAIVEMIRRLRPIPPPDQAPLGWTDEEEDS